MLREIFRKNIASAYTGLVDEDTPHACLKDVCTGRPAEKHNEARKPGVPLLLVAAVVFWVTSALIYCNHVSSGDLLGSRGMPIMVGVAGVFVLGAIFLRRSLLILVALFGVLGVSVGCFGTDQMIRFDSTALDSGQMRRFVLVGDSSLSEFGSSCTAEVEVAPHTTMNVLLYLDTDELFYRGQILEGTATLTSFNEQQADQYWLQGVSKKATLKDFTVVEPAFPSNVLIALRARAIELFSDKGGDQAGLLQALVCGYRNTIRDNGNYEQFKICGIAHIVAVSGAHLAIVATLLMSVLTLVRAPRKIAVALEIMFLLFYLVFAGIPVSALRAVCMVVLSLTSFIALRRSASLNALGLCIIGFILVSPSVSVSLSFFLSAGSVLGIGLFSPLFKVLFATGNDGIDGLVGDQLSLTVASNMITLPASAALFSQLSLISPVANIIATPLFSLGCIAGLVCALVGLIVPAFASLSVGFAALSVMPLSFAVDLMATIPYACIAVAPPFEAMVALSVVLSAVVWALWTRIKSKPFLAIFSVLVVIGACVVFMPAHHGSRISMLDVGQGDSFLIESEGCAVLIDTGNKDSMLREALGQRGIKRLDAVVITHPDSDHCDSLSSLAGYVVIEEIVVANDLIGCSCEHCCDLREVVCSVVGRQPRGLQKYDRIQVGAFDLQVVWPAAFQDEGGNADSLSFLVTCDADADGIVDMKALFCGDAEAEQLHAIKEQGDLCDLDILKVGHHGSKVALDEALIECMSPSLALIGVGANNRYGHPTDETLQLLEDGGVEILRSDLSGSVDIQISAESMSVSCEKQSDVFPTKRLIALD